MATYYKYQNPSDIGAAPTLDWGTVANNINETLQKQEEQRYLNREEDKKKTNDILQKLNEVSMTSDPKANAVLTRGMYEIKNAKFQDYQDLRNGKISRSDFNISGQNTASSIAELNKFSKEYQGRYANFQKALSEGKVTDFSKATQEYMGSFQNMTDKDLIYNRKDGFLYLASLDAETRKPIDGPLGLMPISSLNSEKIYNDTKIDLPTKLASYTDKIQPFIKILREGNIESIEGIQQYSQFNDFMTNLTEAIAPDEFSKADLLTQLGIYDIDIKNPSTDKTIGSKRAGDGTITPDIKPEMNEKLKVALTRFIVANEGYKQTGTEQYRPTGSSGGGSGKDKEKTVEAPYGDIVPTQTSVYEKIGTGKNAKKGKLKSRTTTGVAQDVGYIKVNAGTGITNVIRSVGYENGKLVISGYQIKGKEQEEGTGANKGDTSTEIKQKDFKFDDQESASTLSSYIKLITNPSTGEKFTGIEEAKAFYKAKYDEIKGSGKSTPSATRDEWKKSGWTDSQIDQAKKDGKIIVK